MEEAPWGASAVSTGRVPLIEHERAKDRRHRTRQLEFRPPDAGSRLPVPGWKVHRPADVDDKQRGKVGRLAELAGVDPIRSRKGLPIDVPQIVAGAIVSILAELRAETMKWTAVETLAKTFDGRLRHQLQVAKRLKLGGRNDM